MVQVFGTQVKLINLIVINTIIDRWEGQEWDGRESPEASIISCSKLMNLISALLIRYEDYYQDPPIFPRVPSIR